MTKRISIKNRLLLFSAMLFLVIFIVGSLAFGLSMRDIIHSNNRSELQQIIKIKRLEIESSVNSEIAIILKMADSPILKRYFANPEDFALKKSALEEIEGYKKALEKSTLFWVNDIDKEFYSNMAYVYTIDNKDPKNYWYNMTLKETEKYNFNINYNPDLKNTNLWINAPVFNSNSKSIGIVGVGIDLTIFIQSVYEGYSKNASLYFFNSAGEITGASDANLVSNKISIVDLLGETGSKMLKIAKDLSPNETKNFASQEGEVVVGSIPVFGWNMVAIQPIGLKDYLKTNMAIIYLVMIIVVAFILIIFNVFIGRTKNLFHREALVDALNKMIEIFTVHSEKVFSDVMSSGLAHIASAVGLNRIAVYRVLDKASGRMGQIYVWAYGKTVPLDDQLVELPNVPPIIRWLSVLKKGECVHGNVKDMAQDQADFCSIFNVKAILFVPIFTHGEFWGVVTLEDHVKYRYFEEDSLDLLRSAARLCASAFIRNEMTRNSEKAMEELENRKKMTDSLNKMAITFLSQANDDFDNMMSVGVNQIVEELDLDRITVWRNVTKPDGLHASQIYRWDRESGGTTEPNPMFKDISYSKFSPQWEKLLAENKFINNPENLIPDSDLLKSIGIVSLFITPIFINNSFWGFAIFEDHERKRCFNEESAEFMRTAAFLCANSILHADMRREIVVAAEFNRAILSVLPAGFTIIDDNLRFYECNDAILKILGDSNTTKQYFLENYNEFNPEYQSDGKKSSETMDMLLRRALAGEIIVYNWEHLSISGELIPFEVTLTRTKHKGKYIIMAYQYDLRNIKKMEQALSEAEELTRALTEACPISYVLFDENQKAIDCNKAAIQIFGSPSKQYLLDNYWKLFSPETQSDGQNSFEKANVLFNKLMVEKNGIFEWDHQTINGELLPMENTLNSFIFKEKKFFISFKYDLRSRKSMMDRIYKQSKLLAFRLKQQKLISEISKDFISNNDSAKLIDEAMAKLGNNLEASRMFIFRMDYENSSVIAANEWYANSSVPRLRFNSEFNFFEKIKAMFPEVLLEDTAVHVVYCEDVSADDDYRILESVDLVSFIYAPLYIDGNLQGIITAENCFKPRKWEEDEISFLAMSSTIIAGVIMRDLYDTKLKETLDKVINLSKAKDEFLSKISHEIRTPMNAIMGITEIQLQNEFQPQRKEALSIIYNSGDSLLRIINDLLDLSKIEAKKLEIVPVRYDIASLINDTAQLNMMRTESKPIKFKLNVDENIPAEFYGDELRIKQILNNILSNAFKYTASGEISMTVSSEKSENENFDVDIIFSISDTGRGMTDEQKNKIFEEYSRFNLSNNPSVEGTGLGMAITRNLVSLMSGSISVDSEIGKGSTFTVHLPQKIAGYNVIGKEMALNLQKFRISASQIKRMQIAREPMPYGSVLVVDDVESNLYVAKHLLTPYDLKVDTAMSGFEAIDKIKGGKVYDIVFMDHMMPKMDGIETVKRMRALGYKNTIIALTANAIVGQMEVFLQNGFDGFISKPINTKQLDAELNRFIRDKQPPSVLEEARKHKGVEIAYSEAEQKADAELRTIFARDAKKALPILEDTLKNIESASKDELQAFVVRAHAMKGALANIGETVLSQTAFVLEKAGKAGDKNTIKLQAQEFINNLKEVVGAAELEKKHSLATDKTENTAYLQEQLKNIVESCANYDSTAADLAIENLKSMSWTAETEKVIEKIAEHILHSEFEEAQALAETLFNPNYALEKNGALTE